MYTSRYSESALSQNTLLESEIGLHTVDSVFDGIINQLPRASQDKNGDEKEEEKRAV